MLLLMLVTLTDNLRAVWVLGAL